MIQNAFLHQFFAHATLYSMLNGGRNPNEQITTGISRYGDVMKMPKPNESQLELMGVRIKELRIERGLSQSELGDLVGVTKSAVSQWEHGHTTNIRLTTFFRLIEVLKTDYAYLAFGPQRRAPRLDSKESAKR